MGTLFVNGQPTDNTRNSAGDNYLVVAEGIGLRKRRLWKRCGSKNWRTGL